MAKKSFLMGARGLSHVPDGIGKCTLIFSRRPIFITSLITTEHFEATAFTLWAVFSNRKKLLCQYEVHTFLFKQAATPAAPSNTIRASASRKAARPAVPVHPDHP